MILQDTEQVAVAVRQVRPSGLTPFKETPGTNLRVGCANRVSADRVPGIPHPLVLYLAAASPRACCMYIKCLSLFTFSPFSSKRHHHQPPRQHLRDPAISPGAAEKRRRRETGEGGRERADHGDRHPPDQRGADLQYCAGAGVERWGGHSAWQQLKGKWGEARPLYTSTLNPGWARPWRITNWQVMQLLSYEGSKSISLGSCPPGSSLGFYLLSLFLIS